MNFAVLKIPAVLAAAALVAGCAGVRAHKGAVIDQQLVTGIQPGIDNKASVEKLLGRPTLTGQFSPNDWYYVSRETTQVAFRNPRVQRQTVLHVRFDQAGNVISVNRTGKELVASIDPANRKTPTLGRERSFFEELFGNIGTVGSAATPGRDNQ
jgi:outer membrane protein assembly factor BamE (lipoprotein component of BamABCDE complex)